MGGHMEAVSARTWLPAHIQISSQNKGLQEPSTLSRASQRPCCPRLPLPAWSTPPHLLSLLLGPSLLHTGRLVPWPSAWGAGWTWACSELLVRDVKAMDVKTNPGVQIAARTHFLYLPSSELGGGGLSCG